MQKMELSISRKVNEDKREVLNKYKLIYSFRKNNKGYYIYSNEKINENSTNKKS